MISSTLYRGIITIFIGVLLVLKPKITLTQIYYLYETNMCEKHKQINKTAMIR